AEVDGRRLDVRAAGGIVTEVGTLRPQSGDDVHDAHGGALLPGLTDHHLHLHAIAAADRSVSCGPPSVRNPAELAAALTAATADEHGWIRGTGYAPTVAGNLDAAGLDCLHAARPVRIQHRGGALWIVNTVGAAALGLAGADHPGIERDGVAETPTGRIWRADDWLREHLPGTPPDLAVVGTRLARLGITAVTDATPDLDPAALAAIGTAITTAALPQRVHLLGVPLDRRAPTGATTGPYKIVLADSGLPSLAELADRIRDCRTAHRSVAAHCVTREALILLLAALDGRHDDRVEHGALIPVELIPELAARGLRVVTQPGFLADRGDDYLRDVPDDEHADLYRCASLRAAGIPLALSSDAPYGPLDPWTVIATATERRTREGNVVGPAERLTAQAALDAYLAPPANPGGQPTRIAPGAPADLVLLNAPLADVLAAPSAEAVRMTLIDGVPVD
ncbi:MAG TPA: amidohydrolase family protein, partial [Pseudonocardiaceae bacterium]